MAENNSCKSHIEKHANMNENCKNMRDWIISTELRNDQIISITSGLSNLEEEKHVLILFYRTASNSDEPPLLQINFENGKSSQDWNEQFEFAEELSKTNKIISVSNTPMGDLLTQNVWVNPLNKTLSEATSSIKCFYDESKAGNIEDFIRRSVDWLKNHILPHQIESISLFEEEHDPTTVEFFFSVTHTAGENLEPLAETNPTAYDLNDYKLEFIKTSSSGKWSNIASDVSKYVNKYGADQGYKISISNFSFG